MAAVRTDLKRATKTGTSYHTTELFNRSKPGLARDFLYTRAVAATVTGLSGRLLLQSVALSNKEPSSRASKPRGGKCLSTNHLLGLPSKPQSCFGAGGNTCAEHLVLHCETGRPVILPRLGTQPGFQAWRSSNRDADHSASLLASDRLG